MAIRTISAAYFVGEILIPNVSGTTTTELANLQSLQLAIAKHEPLFLKALLGENLYLAYVAGIAAVSPEAKWVTLNNMLYYTDAALTALNTGISVVAYYVYFYFIKNQITFTLATSEGKGSSENFERANSVVKMTRAWNEMKRLADEIQLYIAENPTDYPEYSTSDVAPTVFESINQWGI